MTEREKFEEMTMTREDILSMARDACYGLRTMQLDDSFGIRTIAYVFSSDLELERFAELVAANEREECAKAVEAMIHGNVRTCSRTIRARGVK